jgi:membrane-associated phospholipid phosphatase
MPSNPACTPFSPVIDGISGQRYALKGPQVEPGAGYWTFGPCAIPCVVRISELLPFTDNPENKDCYFPPYPSDPKVIKKELDELKQLAADRDKDLPAGYISKFLQLRPPPIGAVYCLEREQTPLKTLDEQCKLTGPPVIKTGRELARYFEAETPGLAARQALNCLIRTCDLSPVRQARIWMALDVAIYSALLAAWYYKWAGDRPCTAYRPRPWEVDHTLNVEFDKCVNATGCADDGKRLFPNPTPGTPRHPAYPSGHSTYSGAASELLTYFFPSEKAELDKLADNTGLARLWAGIHWRSDHEAGQRLGRCVARMVISQLESDGVPKPTKPPAHTPANEQKPAPSKEEVRIQSYKERSKCLKDPSDNRCFPPIPNCEGDKDKGEHAAQSVQQGAR